MASRAIGVPLPTVSRKIAELESHLGAQLLVRSTRRVTVTDSGQRYYDDVCRILDDIGDAERQVSGEHRHAKGRLSITSPTLFGRLHVLPIVDQFLRTYPDVNVRLQLSNTVLDLLEEEINLAIRIGTLADSSAVAMEVGALRQIVCASPSYLGQHGRPRSPAELADHQCISLSTGGVPAAWSFRTPPHRIEFVQVPTRLTLNSLQGLVDSAVRDGGLAQLYAYQAASQVAAGELEIVLSHYEVRPIPVSLIYPQGKLAPQKLRAFVDFAAPRLRKCLAVVDAQCAVDMEDDTD